MHSCSPSTSPHPEHSDHSSMFSTTTQVLLSATIQVLLSATIQVLLSATTQVLLPATTLVLFTRYCCQLPPRYSCQLALRSFTSAAHVSRLCSFQVLSQEQEPVVPCPPCTYLGTQLLRSWIGRPPRRDGPSAQSEQMTLIPLSLCLLLPA
jgi:hypothetical protein